jgi:preprotein translocase subunit SecF
MKTLLVVVVLLLIGIVAFAFNAGWFHLSTTGTDQKPGVTITVDKDKMHADEQKAKETVEGLGQKAKETTGNLTDKVKQ